MSIFFRSSARVESKVNIKENKQKLIFFLTTQLSE